jgi:hypothetical protein
MKRSGWIYITIAVLLLILIFFFIWEYKTWKIKEPPLSNLEECGVENCHGDIVCGPNIVEICDEMFAIEDACRQYESCKIVDGECVVERTPEFYTCKSNPPQEPPVGSGFI